MGVVSTMLYFGYMCVPSTPSLTPNPDPDPDPNPNPRPSPSPSPNPALALNPTLPPTLTRFVASMGFLLVTGTVGYMCSWWFVLQIYGAVKVD